jgi:hypothetical protein
MRADCYIWGLPNMCRPCKRALASGEPNLNPAMSYPTAEIPRSLPLAAAIKLRNNRPPARSAAADDLPAEPTTPVNCSPPKPEVDEVGKDCPAEDADEGWRLIQRVLDGSAWDDPDRSGM